MSERKRGAQARLTAEQIVAIREAVAAGTETRATIAERFGISQSYLYKLVRGDAWQSAGGQIRRRTGPHSNTGYFGVTANGAGNRFTVTIRENGKQKSIGFVKDAIEGARRYDARARELGFPPEKLNFPDDEGCEP